MPERERPKDLTLNDLSFFADFNNELRDELIAIWKVYLGVEVGAMSEDAGVDTDVDDVPYEASHPELQPQFKACKSLADYENLAKQIGLSYDTLMEHSEIAQGLLAKYKNLGFGSSEIIQ